MCYFSQYIENGRYKENKTNGGIIPPVHDIRVLYVPYGCGKCKQCREQRARGWQVRLLEDIKDNHNGLFVTLTFSTEALKELTHDVRNWIIVDGKRTRFKNEMCGYQLDNAIATRAMRLFNERWRKKYKKAIRHWMITELGHQGTEHMHMHGILYTNENPYEITDKWQYGYTWLGDEVLGKITNYVGEATVNYITKYVSKMDFQHREYYPKVLTSPGIGAGYIKRAWLNKFEKEHTIDSYKTSTGHMIAMPSYLRKKLYTDEEREMMWINQMNKGIRYIGKEKVKANDIRTIDELTKYYREINNELGYGSNEKNYDRIQYEEDRRKIIQETRIKRKEAQEQAQIKWYN